MEDRPDGRHHPEEMVNGRRKLEKLRIGLMAPPWFSVPPTGYGGIERVVSVLAEGLVRRGHDVTLFAAGGSQTGARLVSTFETPPSRQIGNWMVEALSTLDAYAFHRDFDVIHDHSSVGPLVAPFINTPVVHTVHGKLYPEAAALYCRLAHKLSYVCISEDQQSSMPKCTRSTVIHNGIDTCLYPFNGAGGEYLLFVGRMSPDKGVVEAIEIARRTQRRLLILAKINEDSEREYFDSHVVPALDGVDAEVVEHASHEFKAAAYGNALATLFPIKWREPFGLVMTESMATGTPVIAFRNGSVPEVIADGETGFICETVDEACALVERAREIDRRACRERVEALFSGEQMVLRHEELYAEVVGCKSGRTGRTPVLALPAS